MRNVLLVLGFIVLLIGPAKAADTYQIADPGDTQWLYSYVKETGYVTVERDGDQTRVRSFSTSSRYDTPYPLHCWETHIEVEVRHVEVDWKLFVFDSMCSLPVLISSGTIQISGHVRLVINSETGHLELGGLPWVVENDEPKFIDRESLKTVIRETIADMVQARKLMLEHFPNVK